MGFTAPLAQPIKFLAEGETPFNDLDICGCDTREQWKYTVTDGDTICFQLSSQCDLGEDIILNGSFEDGTDANFADSEWTRSVFNSELTNVRRLINSDAQCGNYIAFWNNENNTANPASITQTYTDGFSIGQLYILTLKSKLTELNTGNSNSNILKLTIGGQEYYITPTTSWVEYTIYVTFASAPSNNDIKIEINTDNPANISELYLDCVEMKLVDGCCIKSHINNGDFELGQVAEGEILGTADNWTLSSSTISETGSEDESRCAELTTIGSSITQENILINGDMFLKFRAKCDLGGDLEIYTLPVSALIGTFTLNSTWQEFTLAFTNTTDTDIELKSATANPILIDDVEIFSIPDVTLEAKEIGSEDTIAISADVLSYTSDAIIACIPVSDIEDLFECFQIKVTSADCEQTLTTEQFTYNPVIDSCLKELIWYDNTDYAMGIDYSTGYQNKIRVKAQLTNPQYEKIDYTKSLDGDVSNITAGKIRKTIELSLDALPEFIWDRISTMILVSNISYDGVSLCSGESTEINTQPDKNSRLISGTILLYPEGEFIAEKSINCS